MIEAGRLQPRERFALTGTVDADDRLEEVAIRYLSRLIALASQRDRLREDLLTSPSPSRETYGRAKAASLSARA